MHQKARERGNPVLQVSCHNSRTDRTLLAPKPTSPPPRVTCRRHCAAAAHSSNRVTPKGLRIFFLSPRQLLCLPSPCPPRVRHPAALPSPSRACRPGCWVEDGSGRLRTVRLPCFEKSRAHGEGGAAAAYRNPRMRASPLRTASRTGATIMSGL